MLTALVLQLIQCVVVLPKKMASANDEKFKVKQSQSRDQEVIDLEGGGGGGQSKDPNNQQDPEDSTDPNFLINKKYHSAMATTHKFLTAFLDKCSGKGKNDDIDYRWVEVGE